MSSVNLPNFVEGVAPFDVPAAGKPCKTWYKVSGDLKSGIRPLVVLHGGPGCAHEYLEIVAQLTTLYAIPVVLYDQIGNGRSTHLPEKNGDTDFWTVSLFVDELHNLLDHLGIHDDFNLLGQSWGGMLGAVFATQRPKGLHKLVIADSPASMKLWMEAAALLRRQLPQGVQDMLNKHEAEETTTHEDYLKATQVFYEHFLCRVKPMPEALKVAMEWTEKDPTVYMTMNGPNEFHIVGSLKTWSIIDDLYKINVPTLLLNGRYDEAHDLTVEPYFQHIPKVKWIQFAHSAHVPQLEETERFMEVVGNFLLKH
ncbi:proline-specific peptidase [Boletus edulis BED1]|uniref:Proline-specific peptidase n=1 Tax=Boletus edulis BED1 TaxID=1328754 RepID=A0AAD4C511_BOLED|nr:proline-specific peptidase [Boletus edulis BED1]